MCNEFVKIQSCYDIETSHLTCSENQLTGFYVMAILALYRLMLGLFRFPVISNKIRFQQILHGYVLVWCLDICINTRIIPSPN